MTTPIEYTNETRHPLITIDFETYYDVAYTLSKMMTLEYIYDKRFKEHMVGVKCANLPTEVYDSLADVPWLTEEVYSRSTVVMQNAAFDGSIVYHKYGWLPAMFIDTRDLSKFLHGSLLNRHSLDNIADFLGIGSKAAGVLNRAKGVQNLRSVPGLYEAMRQYCALDVDLTAKCCSMMLPRVPTGELVLSDMTIRGWIAPTLGCDGATLDTFLEEEANRVRRRDERTLEIMKFNFLYDPKLDANQHVRKNTKLTQVLTNNRVVPPTKWSEKQEKMVPATAKTDEEFVALSDHPIPDVRHIVEHRIGANSSLLAARAGRFLWYAKHLGALPAPLNYCGATQTGRWSGADKINIQNLPKGVLRKSIIAPPGSKVVVADLSAIEARVVNGLAGNQEVIDAFRRQDTGGQEVYCHVASKMFGFEVTSEEEYPHERTCGKVVTLSAGYGVGGPKLQVMARNWGLDWTLDESKGYIKKYRETHQPVVQMWYQSEDALRRVMNGYAEERIGAEQQCRVFKSGQDVGIQLPNGFVIWYQNLREGPIEEGFGGKPPLIYKTNNKTYGGHIVENMCQALARAIFGDQLVRLVRAGLPPAMTVHDEGVWVVSENRAQEVADMIEYEMSSGPDWWPSLPIKCGKPGIADRYSDAK